MYRADAARSGYTPEPLAAELSPAWVYRPAGKPQPAWPRSKRLTEEKAFGVVAAAGKVFFGSSADCAVYCLDAATGREAWSFVTDGPVRHAPALWRPKGSGEGGLRVLATSDDGVLYCLAARDGKLLWKHRGGPAREMLLGNDRLVSRWCARGGAAIVGDTVYFGAGIWPSEGIILTALDVPTGKVLWSNDKLGGLYMPQPHGGANAHSGISAQGYLAVAGESLFVPTGRAVPAALSRRDGALRYFHLQKYGMYGGSAVAVIGKHLLNSGVGFDAGTGVLAFRGVPTSASAASPGVLLYYAAGKLHALDADKPMAVKAAGGKPALNVKWSVPVEAGGSALIVAGKTAVSGGKGKVMAVDLTTRKAVFSAEVDGEALGLTAAGGRLLVSTDSGAIHCFATGTGGPPAPVVAPDPKPVTPFGDNAPQDAAAETILRRAGVTEGYCVDLACGEGQLAYALARRSKLHVYAVDSDPANVAAARKALRAAGVYGTRVTVHLADPKRTPYPDYFADLVVSARGLTGPTDPSILREAGRLLRPGGGVALIGSAGSAKPVRRGPLPGAGEWTHQYHDPANSLCGEDQLIRGPLRMLWFSSPDLRLPNRHGRAPAPLFANGRLFAEGVDGLRALNAYNGRLLWEFPLPNVLKPYHQEHIMGAAGTGSNFCLGAGSVFVHTGDRCLRLAQATGRKIAAFDAPPLADGTPGRWGYVAFADGTLFGSLADTQHLVPYRFRRSNMGGMFTESRTLFAMDPLSGKVRWRYEAAKSIRNNTIAIAGGKVFLIDRAKANEIADRRAAKTPQPTGVLLALDAKSGKVLWRNEKDIYGTMLAVSEAHGVVLMCYQDTRFKLRSELGGRMTALHTATGEPLWDIRVRTASRPLINGGTIYAQPHAWDLLTGRQKTVRDRRTGKETPWAFARSYGCGTISSAPGMLLFRSATLGYRDVLADHPTTDYGGIRPGCWINVIPAGGLVLMPDATTGCTCSYLNKATVALQPRGAWPPTITPDGGAFRRSGTVTIQAPAAPPGAEIRYTLDGSTPTADAKTYVRPLTIDRTVTLKVRLFRSGRPAGDTASARFVVDKDLLPTGGEAWEVWDAPGPTDGPSRWGVKAGTITQQSNIYTGSAGAATPDRARYGTLRIYRGGKRLGDGELTLEIRSQDDDMLGVAFRVQDARRHYLWAMDKQRRQHVLACRNGEKYTALAANTEAYRTGQWHKVRIVLAGPRITVFLDGRKDLEAVDTTFAAGTIALHVWGNTGSSFRAIRWKPADRD